MEIMNRVRFALLALGCTVACTSQSFAASSEALSSATRAKAGLASGNHWVGNFCVTPDGERVNENVKENCPTLRVYPPGVENAVVDAAKDAPVVEKAGWFGWSCSDARPSLRRGGDDLGLVDNRRECAERAKKCGYVDTKMTSFLDDDGDRKIRCVGYLDGGS